MQAMIGMFVAAVQPFMVATRFTLKNVDDILNCQSFFHIANRSLSALQLADQFFCFPLLKNPVIAHLDITKILQYPAAKRKIDDAMDILYNDFHRNAYDLSERVFERLSQFTSKEETQAAGGATTPYTLVKEIVDDLGCLTGRILDPSCGRGPFLFEVKRRRMANGMTEAQANQGLIGLEIDIRKAFIAAAILDMYNQGGVEIYLQDAFKINRNMQADRILGNPPYNKGIVKRDHTRFYNSISGMSGKYGNYAFTKVAIDQLVDGGQFSYVMPTNFMVLSNGKDFRRWLREYDINEIRIFDNNHFDVSVSGPLCILRGTKAPSTGKTVIRRIYDGKTYETTVDLRTMDYFPLYMGDLGRSILGKVQAKGKKLIRKEWKATVSESDVQSATHPYLCLRRPNGGVSPEYCYTNIKDPASGTHRVAISHLANRTKQLTLNSVVIEDAGVHQNCNYFVCDSKDDALILQQWFQQPLFNLCILQLKDLYKFMDYNIGRLTVPDLALGFVDQDAFDYYGLTQEEIDFVRNL
jgi:hypothetical protein